MNIMLSSFRILTFALCLISIASFTFAICGDGVLDAGEQCDGTNFNGLTCEKLDRGFTGGILRCASDCTLDSSFCNFDTNYVATTGPYCGDGIIQGNEQCDGANLGGKTCAELGYLSGNLSCTSQCIFDFGNCTSTTIVTNNLGDANAPVNALPNASDIVASIQSISLSPETIALILVLLALLLFVPAARLKARKSEKEKKAIFAEMKRKR